MKRHAFKTEGLYFAVGPRFPIWRWQSRRNWPCGACGLWKRAKVHR